MIVAKEPLNDAGVFHAGKACVWTTLPNGIHVFTITESSKKSTDEWLAHLNIIFADKSNHDEVRYIMDYRYATPPLAYGFQRAREWLAKNPDMAQTKVAFVYQSATVTHLLNAFIKLLHAPHVTTHFFNSFDAAEAWLLS